MPKFLHAADLHIDSPLRGLDNYDGAPIERIRGATRAAFEKLITLALEEEVRFVILAGDIFDTNPLVATSIYFNKAIQRLTERGIPVYILRGNHDHAGIVPRGRTLVDGVHIFSSDAPQTFELDDVALHGRSYPTPAVHLDLTVDYPAPIRNKLNIGVLHTALGGYPEHAPYAPTSPETLASKGYHYWALGHVHRFAEMNEGGTHIVFPGNLQGRHIRETGPKGAALVEYEGERIVSIAHRPLDVARWHLLELELEELDDTKLIRAAVEAIEEASNADRMEGRLAIFRLRAQLHRDLGFDLREALTQALTHLGDEVWIEKVELRRVPDHRASSEFLARLAELAESKKDEFRAKLLGERGARDELKGLFQNTDFSRELAADTELREDLRSRLVGDGDEPDLSGLLTSALELIAAHSRNIRR